MRRPKVCFATASIKVAGANGAYTRANPNGPRAAIASSSAAPSAGASRTSTAAANTWCGLSIAPRASTVTLKLCLASVVGRRIPVPPTKIVHIPMTSADGLVFFLQDVGKLLWLTNETGLAAAGYTPGEIG
jgi:hypothetical protein